MVIRLEVVEQVMDCEACALREGATMPVPINGLTPTAIAVVGGAPSEADDVAGRPFSDDAGELLREAMAKVKLDPATMAFFNTVACRTSKPAPIPSLSQIAACTPNRVAQLELVEARWVLLLGRASLRTVAPELDIELGRCRPFERDGRVYFATYHPATALRDPAIMKLFRSDLEVFRVMMDVAAETGTWNDFVADSCSGCGTDCWTWITEEGMPWCEKCLPALEREKFEDWMTVKAERSAMRDAATLVGDAEWPVRAWSVLVGYLRSHDEFFVDSFWADSGIDVPREARALGPLVNQAARQGLMEKTGEFRKSTASNMSEKPVWRSLLRGGG